MAGEKLICFDFDQTLMNGHFHSTLAGRRVTPNIAEPGVQVLQPDGSFKRSIQQWQNPSVSVPTNLGADPRQIQAMIQDPTLGPKHAYQMALAIRTAIDNGHKVAIVSFTLYPEVIVPSLKAILGQNADRYISQICVVGGFPSDNKPDKCSVGKEEHIHEAIRHFRNQRFDIKRSDVMLVDDSKHNLDMAVDQNGAPLGKTVEVPKEKNPPLSTNNYFAPIMSHVAVNLRAQNVQANVSQVQPPPAQVINQQPQVQYFATNQMAAPMNKLRSQTVTAWETRPTNGTAISQVVSAVLNNESDAKKLLSQMNPALNGEIFPSSSGGYRVVIEAKEMIKLNSLNAKFSTEKASAQVNVQNPTITTKQISDINNYLRYNYEQIQSKTNERLHGSMTYELNVKSDGSYQVSAMPHHLAINKPHQSINIPLSANDVQSLLAKINLTIEQRNELGLKQQQAVSSQATTAMPHNENQKANAPHAGPSQPAQKPLPLSTPVPTATAQPVNTQAVQLQQKQPVQANTTQAMPQPQISPTKPYIAQLPPQPLAYQVTSNQTHGALFFSQPIVKPSGPPPQPGPYTPVSRVMPIVTSQPQPSNLPPPVNQNLVVESNKLDALNNVFDTPVATLKGKYQTYSKDKHSSKNHHVLHSFAKSVAKSISGVAKERDQQVKDISIILQVIKADPNINALDKATLAYAYLENVKSNMKNVKSGIKDLCDSLQKQIVSAIPDTKNNYESNRIAYQENAKEKVEQLKGSLTNKHTIHKP